ncbi:hypothetical protein PN499_22050 [Kamptonema animale CS-326]|jgi:hypothetical protein|uniref:hypothetical protein n=1 Tax=Kamptonema animale TaxID=92934 RepID=UPI00232C39CD|nr:hypothetical protein [Kamptonema animale]MDB9513886.1 hypothetical protein [Kamptonema animale CS-326]
MNSEDNHKLLIEIISRLTHVETRLEIISKSSDDLNSRLEMIEINYQKSVGVIQFASAIMAVGVVFLITFINLWIDDKIEEYYKTNSQHEIQNQILKK